MIGVALGLVLGIAIVAVLFLRDKTFRTEADVLDVLALPVLALVPLVIDSGRASAASASGSADDLYGRAAAVVSGGIVTWSMKLWRYMA